MPGCRSSGHGQNTPSACALPRDPGVVVRAAGRDRPHLLEHLATAHEVELVADAEAPGEVAQHVDVGCAAASGATAWSQRTTRPSMVVIGALLLGEGRAGQHHRRVASRRLGQERVDHRRRVRASRICSSTRPRSGAETLMLLEIDSSPLISPRPAIWRISTYVAPTPGSDVGVDAPPFGDDRAVLGIADRSTGGELVAALAPLAAALAVALTGEHVDAAARLADVAAGERDVDHRQHVVGAHRLLLGPAGVEDHAPFGGPDQPGQFAHGGGRRRR